MNPAPVSTTTPNWIALVEEKVKSLQFGVVQIVVHNSRVTQIERTEKTRVEEPTTTRTSLP